MAACINHLCQVKNLCEFLVNNNIEQQHPLHIPLMTALHTLYGKPFKQRKEVRVGEEIIPVEFKDIHTSLITMRDKIHAHTDVDGPLTANNESLNKVVAFIQNRSVRFAVSVVFPRNIQVAKIRVLATPLAKRLGITRRRFGKST